MTRFAANSESICILRDCYVKMGSVLRAFRLQPNQMFREAYYKMTREELIEELSDLRDYHTVTQRTCDFLKMDLLRKDDHYNPQWR